MQRKNMSDELVSFYEEQLCSMADSVYRLVFAMTLNPDSARAIVTKAYEEVAARLETIRAWSDRDLKTLVVAECWKAYLADKAKTNAAGSSAVAQVLKPLSVEARAAMVAVDVSGLTATEAAKAFEWNEKKLRQHLAEGRKSLVGQSLET